MSREAKTKNIPHSFDKEVNNKYIYRGELKCRFQNFVEVQEETWAFLKCFSGHLQPLPL